MKVFPERREDLEEIESRQFRPCMKRPVVIHAVKVDFPFRVNTLEGDYKQGKAGDFLMCGVEDELYICDKEIFEETYDFLK